jgi:hypothetical protein
MMPLRNRMNNHDRPWRKTQENTVPGAIAAAFVLPGKVDDAIRLTGHCLPCRTCDVLLWFAAAMIMGSRWSLLIVGLILYPLWVAGTYVIRPSIPEGVAFQRTWEGFYHGHYRFPIPVSVRNQDCV